MKPLIPSKRLGVRRFTSKSFYPGQPLQFTYDGEQKYAIVLNPLYDGKVHAVSLKPMSERMFVSLLKTVASMTTPAQSWEFYKRFRRTPGYMDDRLYRTYILKKMSAIREIYIKDSEE